MSSPKQGPPGPRIPLPEGEDGDWIGPIHRGDVESHGGRTYARWDAYLVKANTVEYWCYGPTSWSRYRVDCVLESSMALYLHAAALQREREKAEAERDAARADVVTAAGELLVSLADAPPGSLAARLLVANCVLRGERDKAMRCLIHLFQAIAYDGSLGQATDQVREFLERQGDDAETATAPHDFATYVPKARRPWAPATRMEVAEARQRAEASEIECKAALAATKRALEGIKELDEALDAERKRLAVLNARAEAAEAARDALAKQLAALEPVAEGESLSAGPQAPRYRVVPRTSWQFGNGASASRFWQVVLDETPIAGSECEKSMRQVCSALNGLLDRQTKLAAERDDLTRALRVERAHHHDAKMVFAALLAEIKSMPCEARAHIDVAVLHQAEACVSVAPQ